MLEELKSKYPDRDCRQDGYVEDFRESLMNKISIPID